MCIPRVDIFYMSSLESLRAEGASESGNDRDGEDPNEMPDRSSIEKEEAIRANDASGLRIKMPGVEASGITGGNPGSLEQSASQGL